MNKFAAYFRSLRIRTVPLSLAGVLLGAMLSYAYYDIPFDAWTLCFLLLTTASLQILSNLSNELGDVLHGTDTEERQGPRYGLNSGTISIREMKILIGIFIGLCVIFGLVMIRFSVGSFFSLKAFLLILLGYAAIRGALRYTLGQNPYGYRGLGDVFVFLFFGLVAVVGASFVVTGGTLTPLFLLPGASIGCFSIGVLNVNNIRDMRTDAGHRKTVALRLGEYRAKWYQTLLIVLGWIFFAFYFYLNLRSYRQMGITPELGVRHGLWLLTLPLFVWHLCGVWKRREKALDPMLPLLVLSTFLFAVLAGASCLLLVC